jgi:RNA polymerase sigma factor (sigma-70 family)
MSVGDRDWLAERFEENRGHLRAVAYRMLGSLAEADDAVQETWLRLSRSGAGGVGNLSGWLTTVLARVCLDMLRSRKARREEPLGVQVPEQALRVTSRNTAAEPEQAAGPEQEALLADSVGLALLVVLDTLAPAERVAFVLHDMFDLPFGQIATIMDRSPNAARLLASRARRRIRGSPAVPEADLARQREVVGAFFAASRRGDLDALLALLDPDVAVRADRSAVPAGVPRQVNGAAAVVRQALAYSRIARSAQPVLVNGAVGGIVALPHQPFAVMTFTVTNGKIGRIDIIADPGRLRRLGLAVLDDGG